MIYCLKLNQNKLQINRKEKKLTWRLPAAIWRLSRPSGAAHWPNRQPSPSWLRQKNRGTRRRARPRDRPRPRLPPPPASPPRRMEHPRDATRRPAPLSLSPVPIPSSPSLSLSHGRTRPSPPSTATVASATAAPPRHGPQLRRDPLSLLTEPSNPGELRFVLGGVVFVSGRPRSTATLRPHQPFAELSDDAPESAVSPCIGSPFSSASPCSVAPRSRSSPSSGHHRELRSGELRPPLLLLPAPPDAREPGLRPGALSRRPRGM